MDVERELSNEKALPAFKRVLGSKQTGVSAYAVFGKLLRNLPQKSLLETVDGNRHTRTPSQGRTLSG
jgi:hypothetical protein